MITAKSKLPCLVAVSLLIAAPFAIAQEPGNTEQPPVYQVELLIFQHVDQSQTTSEILRMPEAEIADILEQDLPRLESRQQSETTYAIAGDNPANWRLLDTSQLLLNNVSQRLDKLDAYHLITHTGWLQTAPDVAEANEIFLEDLGIDLDQATGSIKLLKRRYLHLAVDVSLGTEDRDAFQVFSAPKAAPAINDSRRIRLEKLVYFDQPQFGIIAMVARSEVDLELTQ
jgi:hypothetical protein